MLSILSISELATACSYRRPLLVRELMIFPVKPEPYGYYVCPRCRITVEREFMLYCDRCGQHLDWSRYEQAAIIYPGDKNRRAKAKRLGPMGKLRSIFLSVWQQRWG